MPGDEPRDVRDALSELERRLLDLERELRTDASQDAAAAGRPPDPAPPPVAPAIPSASAAGARQAPPEEPAAAAPPGEASPVEDVERLAAEARAKIEALRASLDGLEHASDRLRHEAQGVVADYGRTLVNLDRYRAEAESRRDRPPIPPRAADAEPAPGRGTTTSRPPGGPGRAAPGRATGVGSPRPAASTTAVPSQPGGAPSAAGRSSRRTWLPWLLAAAAAVAVLIAVFAGGGEDRREATPTAPTIAVATDDPAVAGALPATVRPVPLDSATAAIAALCAGSADAALIVLDGAALTPDLCLGVRVRAQFPLTASGLLQPTRAGPRCVSKGRAEQLTRRRGGVTSGLTRRRARAVRAAERRAGSGVTPEAIAARRSAAATAGRSFDLREKLRFIAIRPSARGTCRRPTARTAANGQYPLSTRVVLVTADGPPVADLGVLERSLAAAFSGPLPVSATVLG